MVLASCGMVAVSCNEVLKEVAVRIRPENTSEGTVIRNVLFHAYNDHQYSERKEHRVVDALRHSDAHTLSLVAEDPKRGVVGHLSVSPVAINGEDMGWYCIGPVGVLPEEQKKGVGTALLRRAVRTMDSMGAEGLVLIGNPAYSKRFGFRNDSRLTIPELQPEQVMILPLGKEVPTGIVELHPAFTDEEKL